MRNYSSDLRYDLTKKLGDEAERVVDAFFTQPIVYIEVKRDMRWCETGNIFVETHCYYQESGKYEESGLLITKATSWVYVLGQSKLVVPPHILLTLIKRPDSIRTRHPHGQNPSWGNLLKLTTILAYTQELERENGEI